MLLLWCDADVPSQPQSCRSVGQQFDWAAPAVLRRADEDGRDPSASNSSMGDDTGHLGAATPPGISRRTSAASEHTTGAWVHACPT